MQHVMLMMCRDGDKSKCGQFGDSHLQSGGVIAAGKTLLLPLTFHIHIYICSALHLHIHIAIGDLNSFFLWDAASNAQVRNTVDGLQLSRQSSSCSLEVRSAGSECAGTGARQNIQSKFAAVEKIVRHRQAACVTLSARKYV